MCERTNELRIILEMEDRWHSDWFREREIKLEPLFEEKKNNLYAKRRVNYGVCRESRQAVIIPVLGRTRISGF